MLWAILAHYFISSVRVAMSAAVGTMSSAFPPAVRRVGRRRTVETVAATITLMGAGSDGSESSSSEEANEEPREAVKQSPPDSGPELHQPASLALDTRKKPETKETVNNSNSSANQAKQDSGHSQEHTETLMPNGAALHLSGSPKCVEDCMSDLHISGETEPVSSPDSGRFNPFNRDDLSEVFFDHADREATANQQQSASEPMKACVPSRPGEYLYTRAFIY